jgi:cob(I)alamin adenosyltransferase
MVRLTRIYTRTGDAGASGLATGERRTKSDQRFAVIGTVDETNACVGLARLHCAKDDHLDRLLARIQNDLFDLGADLAVPEGADPKARPQLRVSLAQVQRLEAEIDELNGALAPLTSFVLPGGTPAAAALHLCRTVCRRAERLMVALAEREPFNTAATTFINRLSDLFFVAARHANHNGSGDVLWVPGENR